MAVGGAAPVQHNRGVKRASYHHGDLRRALLRAARALVTRVGPDAFTLREAARACGVDHAAAYRHFRDKRALLAALAEEAFAELAHAIESDPGRTPNRDPGERLQRLGAIYVAFGLANPTRYRLMFGPRLNEDGRFPALEAAIARLLAAAVADVESGIADGSFAARNARDAALAVWSMAHGYVDAVLRRRIRVRSRDAALGHFATLLAPFVSGLRAGEPAGARPASRRRGLSTDAGSADGPPKEDEPWRSSVGRSSVGKPSRRGVGGPRAARARAAGKR